jgi:hypothetical protein
MGSRALVKSSTAENESRTPVDLGATVPEFFHKVTRFLFMHTRVWYGLSGC